MQTQIYRIYTDTPQSTPVNVSRHTYTYTPASYNYVNNYDRWQNNDWQQSAQATVTYLDKDKPLLFFNQVWNSTQGAYVNSYQQVTSYNDRNLQTNFSKQTWDTTNSRWITTYSFISLYNGPGLHTSDTLKTTPRTGDSISTARYYTYYTNIEGRVDSSYEVGMQLQDSTLNHYIYYAQSGKLNRHTARFFYSGTLTGASRVTYVYDTSLNVITDSSFSEFEPFGSDSFIPDDITVHEQYFNTDGQQTKLINKIYEYNNGVITDSSISIIDFIYAP